MTEIFDLRKLTERSFHARKQVALQEFMRVEEAVRIIKRDMAQQLATMILTKEDFFWERADTFAGTAVVEYGVDCVVLTRQELADIQRHSFKQGLEHARGFMSIRS